MKFKHRFLTSDKWLRVRAAGNDAYRLHMTCSEDDEEAAGAKADEVREETLQGILAQKIGRHGST